MDDTRVTADSRKQNTWGLPPKLHTDSALQSITVLLNILTKKPQPSPVSRSIAGCSASSNMRQEQHAHYQKHIRLLQAQNISQTLLINFSSMRDE